MAFFPNLNYFDFRQEGHRLEFTDPEDPNSALQYKGVVYNEMKGAMSDPESAFVHKLNENLFKDSQYRFNSGGEPKFITDLQYQELVDFHKLYYHPTNTHFFTYGDLDFTHHLKFVEEQVIAPNFQRNPEAHKSELTLEKPLSSAIHKEENFMPDMMSPHETQAKLGIAFLCKLLPAKDEYETFALNVLSSILLNGPNAPFYKAIIEEGIAPNFCPGSGFDSTTRQPTFTVGVQGVTIKDLTNAENVIFQTLQDVKKEGIDAKLFEQTLHEIEFEAKKTRANTGLMYISHLVPYALHGGDPLTVFKINEFSQKLREDFASGGYFEGLIDKHLLQNRHYLRLLYTPDPKKDEREEALDRK